jgi:hypothetical protein
LVTSRDHFVTQVTMKTTNIASEARVSNNMPSVIANIHKHSRSSLTKLLRSSG